MTSCFGWGCAAFLFVARTFRIRLVLMVLFVLCCANLRFLPFYFYFVILTDAHHIITYIGLYEIFDSSL
jgi:hypothetical protein